MSDVARIARVSRVTASKVLNDPRAGSAEVRRRVEEACERLAYVPSLHARHLVAGGGRTIGMLVASLTNTFYAEIVEAAERHAEARGYDLVHRASGDDPAREAQMIRHLLSLDVVGLVATPTASRENLPLWQRVRAARPVVFIDHHFGRDDTHVTADHAAGAEAATRHLLEGGRAPTFLEASAPATLQAVRARRQGYLRALRAAGLPPRFLAGDPRLHDAPETYGYEALRAALVGAEPPEALFCTNDLQALGATRALREAGLVVGRDVLVAGYDDHAFSAYVDPALTTVRQPKHALGAEAVRLLLEALAPGGAPARRTVLPVELVVRASSGGGLERHAPARDLGRRSR